LSRERPIVGITTSYPDTERGRAAVAPYVAAVARAGGAPLVLPNDAARVDEILAGCAAIVLSGGGDVAVERYGGRPHEAVRAVPPERDEFEIALVRATRARAVPTLCICRGLEVANVAFGGGLVEHLPDILGPDRLLEHAQVDASGLDRDDYAPGHVVSLDPNGTLARLVGRDAFETNSMHHQAVDPRRVGEGFRVGGETPDGVVEALEPTFAHPFFVAVQWHPEELWSPERGREDPVAIGLFAGLIRAAAESQAK